jgi:peptidoglycan/LPS O-acetylase OafA/YrhL
MPRTLLRVEVTRIFGLDLMRAVAISLVICSHFLKGVDILGVFGVELFFVLSGFLIGGILLRTVETKGGFGFTDLREFLRRRWYRTLPNYYLFLIIYTVVQVAAYSHRLPSIGWFARYAMFLQNFAWPNPNWMFGHSWSLCVEEWFYLLTSGILFLTSRLFSPSRNGRAWALGMTFGTVLIVPAVLRFALQPFYGDVRMITVFRLDAISLGILMAVMRSHMPGAWNRFAALLCLGFASMALAVFISGWSGSTTATSLTLMPLGCALLIPACCRLPKPVNLLRRWVVNLSIWSYSLYLCHPLIYIGLASVFGYNMFSQRGKLLFKLFTLVVVVCISALNFRFFEKKMTDLRERAPHS